MVEAHLLQIACEMTKQFAKCKRAVRESLISDVTFDVRHTMP